MSFERAMEKADVWIKGMMRELGTDEPAHAYRALGALLQALRDRLGVNEAAQLAAQLPLLVRGLFYEGWHPASLSAGELSSLANVLPPSLADLAR